MAATPRIARTNYHADGKRVGIHPGGKIRKEFIYQGPDMLKLLLERDEAGETQAHYTMGNGLESVRQEAESSFYHYDALGSTYRLTDPVEEVTDTYRYNAWGEILGTTGDTFNRHTFVGRERYSMSRNSAYALLGLRYYVPKVGRFWTSDPAKTRIDRYVYAGNWPTRITDPSGMQPVSTAWAKHFLNEFKQGRGQAMVDVFAIRSGTGPEVTQSVHVRILLGSRVMDPVVATLYYHDRYVLTCKKGPLTYGYLDLWTSSPRTALYRRIPDKGHFYLRENPRRGGVPIVVPGYRPAPTDALALTYVSSPPEADGWSVFGGCLRGWFKVQSLREVRRSEMRLEIRYLRENREELWVKEGNVWRPVR